MRFFSSSRKSVHKSVFVLPLLACGLLVIGSRTAVAQPNGQPPLIDRELFFGDPEISGAQISPDGKFIAFIKPFKGTRNIWVKRTETAFETAKAITADTSRPIRIYFWSRDGKYILFVQRLRNLWAGPVSQGWPARLFLDKQRSGCRFYSARPVRACYRQGRSRR